jgi:four helix bundle suffix protein
MPSKNQYNEAGFIPKHGGYRNLIAFQKTEIIYDGTVYFCKRFYSKDYRTTDQMVQAARSGKQNIAEGSKVSGTSKEAEIKLTNVARASLEELLNDYKDFLRIRKLKEWEKNHPYVKRLQELNKIPNGNYETYKKGIENKNPEICANVLIGLIKVTNYLLDHLLKRLEEDFLKAGGLKERMMRARINQREKDRKGYKI